MALIDGEWLDYDARAARIALEEARLDKLKRLHSAGKLTPAQVASMVADTRSLVRLKRIHRGERDVLFFTYEYFSEESNADNSSNLIPAGQNFADAAKFHRELCGL